METSYSMFLSVICVVQNQSSRLERVLHNLTLSLSKLVSDFELIIIDNSSIDDSIAILKSLTMENGLPNIQVFTLTKEIDTDKAYCIGIENALGDFVVLIDPFTDDINIISEMLDKTKNGIEVVFAKNKLESKHNAIFRISYFLFNYLFKVFNGVYLTYEAPKFRLMSKRVVNFILKHPQPYIAYRHLPLTGGFARININYSYRPIAVNKKKLGNSINRGITMLTSASNVPLRFVTSISLFAAVANVLYSIYVVIIAIFKTNVTPGWISLSLQHSGMFFLISLVLFVLSEYIMNIVSLTKETNNYNIDQEFTSFRKTFYEKLNVEEIKLQRNELNLNYKNDEKVI